MTLSLSEMPMAAYRRLIDELIASAEDIAGEGDGAARCILQAAMERACARNGAHDAMLTVHGALARVVEGPKTSN